MKKCPVCGNVYPEPFQFCPVDGGQLAVIQAGTEDPAVIEAAPRSAAATHIRVKTLIVSLMVLILVASLAFASVFLYQYWKPKYGALVLKTTPPGAMVYVDGKQRGVSPVTISGLKAGGYQVKATLEGYKDFVQQVEVMPYSTENLHWSLDPTVPHLTNEQLAEVESWRKKLDSAQKENILLPPPEDYNVLYFSDKILSIDPANAYALEVKGKLAESIRHAADLAYAREDWLEAEKQYKNLALLFPNDVSINERITDIAAKIDASLQDREKQVADWKAKAEAALKAGSLVPPDKENALDAVRNISRLDKRNDYARTAMKQIKEMLQNRGDTKLSAGDFQGARNDFKLVLQYFPDDPYSRARLTTIDAKLAEANQTEQQRIQRMQEEQQSRQKVTLLRQAGLNSYRAGAYQKAIAEWQDYLKVEPNSDEAFFYIGASYLEQKQYDTAILNFEKCLALNPNNGLAHLNLGILYDRHRNDLKRAIEHLRKVKDLGGVEKYNPERLQSMIQDLQDRLQLDAMQNTLFAVEHKHAFSSCRGNIRLGQEGIEFKTTETDHSFFEAYSGIREFWAEGDEISIRTRNNKKYNFRVLNSGDGERIRKLASRHLQINR